MGKILLTNIAEELAAKGAISKDAADNFIRAIVETIEKGLREDKVVKIKGLGTFKLMEVSDRGSVDINTGERIVIKGHRKVSFTPDSAMKEFVNRPFAHFEPTELNDGYPEEDEQVMTEGASNDNDEPEVEERIAAVVSEPVDGLMTSTATEASEIHEDTIEDIKEESVEQTFSSVSILSDVAEDTDGADMVGKTEEVSSDAEPEGDEEPVLESLNDVDEYDSTEADSHKKETIVTGESEEFNSSIQEEELEIENALSEDVREVASAQEKSESMDVCEAVPDDSEQESDISVVGQGGAVLETVEEGSIEESTPSQDVESKSKRRSSAGWIILILLIGLAFGMYYLVVADNDSSKKDSYDSIEEYNDMMVNPNLEEEFGEEFGEEWNDKPKVETQQEKAKKNRETAPSTIKTDESEKNLSQETKPAASVSSKATVTDAKKLFCAVTLTEELQAKTIKDITVADTTDYAIDGTLVTHELKSGETIIQLALKYYGDKRLWPYIVKYNWMKDYNHVAIGQMINIPVLKNKDIH